MDQNGTSGNPSEPNQGLSRRGILRAGLVAAAGAGAVGWGSASAAASPAWRHDHHHHHHHHHRPFRQPGSLPYPELAEGTDTVPQIEHIVVVMMENHSYDNHLGMLRRPGADGFRLGRDGLPRASNPYPDGQIQHAFRMPTTCQLSGHPAQDWLASHTQYDGGRLDGFVASASGGQLPSAAICSTYAAQAQPWNRLSRISSRSSLMTGSRSADR